MSKPNKLFTIKVILPDTYDMSPQEEKEYIEHISKDIAAQVSKMVKVEKQKDNVHYWQQKMLLWQIEDYNSDLKIKAYYEQQKRSIGQSAEVDTGREPDDI